MTSLANNEPKPQGPVRIGLIATGEQLQTLAPALKGCLLVQPLAQAGMPQSAAIPDVPWLDDPRVMLGQPGLEAVMLATSTRSHLQLAAQAAEHGLHVWQLPPLARTFAEATELVARTKRLPTIHRVASWWEYVADHVWHELNWPADFAPLYSELRASARGPSPEAWQAIPTDAAGGVLANDAYGLLEALIAVRGLPETADAAIGSYRRVADKPVRQTEDTALAILRYGRGLALVRATWDLPPLGHEILHCGATTRVTLADDLATLTDNSGTLIDQRPLPGEFLSHELMRFAECVRGQARDRAAVALERHLAVSALLEAIYLSARTGHPESPAKFYQVQGWPEPRS
jgi:predicted dehydrogenase